MTEYTENDTVDKLSEDQLKLMARSDHDALVDYLEKNTIFDAHRVRLMLELGRIEAERIASHRT